MISVTGVTNRYTLQPNLIEMHQNSLKWLSSSLLWKRELNFMQKLLDDHTLEFTAIEDKQKVDHFQNLIIYYQGELIDSFRKKLRDHESHLAEVLKHKDETDTAYLTEHKAIMDELKSFDDQFQKLKKELFSFVARVL